MFTGEFIWVGRKVGDGGLTGATGQAPFLNARAHIESQSITIDLIERGSYKFVSESSQLFSSKERCGPPDAYILSAFSQSDGFLRI